MKIQFAVDQLEVGMYVAELDRPWLGTPFLFQGFVIETREEISKIRELCRHVFVDDLKSSNVGGLQQRLHNAVRGSSITVQLEPWPGLEKLKETLRKLDKANTESFSRLSSFDDLSVKYTDSVVQAALDSIGGLIEQASQDPDTSIWISMLVQDSQCLKTHAMGVAALAAGFAAHLGMSVEMQKTAAHGGLLHDIGMVKVPKFIRDKPGPLGVRERILVNHHCEYAARRLAAETRLSKSVIEIVRAHHERCDGSGYPHGLTDTKIPEQVQVVSICDVYDSYTRDQPYRSGMPPTSALGELMKRSRTHFRPRLVEEFVRWLGVYPLGSVVQLKNGAIGVVVHTDKLGRLKPVVLLLRDPRGRELLPRRTVNLRQLEQLDPENGWGIRHIVPADQYQVDVRQVLKHELGIHTA